MPRVYGELRRLVVRYMRVERGNHAPQPNASLNEACTHLVRQPQAPWQSRAQFLATASRLMRHVRVDHVRARWAGKRRGVQRQITPSEDVFQATDRTIDGLVLHEALEHLAHFDPRQVRIVELHFSGGLNFDELA